MILRTLLDDAVRQLEAAGVEDARLIAEGFV